MNRYGKAGTGFIEKDLPVEIYKSWCKGCGICVAVCPQDVLAMAADGYPYAKDPDACTSCGNCDIHCPDFAITGMKKRTMNNRHAEKVKTTAGGNIKK